MRHANGVGYGELDWNRTDGAREAADELLVNLRAGDWVAYEIVVRSPSRFQIVVAGKPDGEVARQPLAISIDGAAVGAEDPEPASVRGTTDELAAGHHVVRLTGLLSDTLARCIEFIPPAALQ